MARYDGIGAAVLAGGAGKRFGGAGKYAMELGGARVMDAVLETVGALFGEVAIVASAANEAALRSEYGGSFGVFRDIIENAGPLGAVHSALSNSSAGAVFCVACDMPFLDRGLIRAMAEAFVTAPCGCHDALVPRYGGLIEPLHSIYSRGLSVKIEERITLTGDLSIAALIRRSRTEYFELADTPSTHRAFFNINTLPDAIAAGAGVRFK